MEIMQLNWSNFLSSTFGNTNIARIFYFPFFLEFCICCFLVVANKRVVSGILSIKFGHNEFYLISLPLSLSPWALDGIFLVIQI